MPCPACGCPSPSPSPWAISGMILLYVLAVIGVLFLGLEGVCLTSRWWSFHERTDFVDYRAGVGIPRQRGALALDKWLVLPDSSSGWAHSPVGSAGVTAALSPYVGPGHSPR